MSPRLVLSILLASLLSPLSANESRAVYATPSTVCSGGTCTVTFSESGDFYSYVVPAGLTRITVTLRGGGGGGTSGGGGVVTGQMTVTAGNTLTIYVGGAGAQGSGVAGGRSGGRSSGGTAPTGRTDNRSGGGHSEITLGGTSLVIAGGGGGQGGWAGGAGGGGGGNSWNSNISAGQNGAVGQAGGGTGGGSNAGSGGSGSGGGTGAAGSGQVGGAGGSDGGAGGGGGGGGGYRGGGGGGGDSNTCCDDGGGGGGGSSYYNSSYFSSAPSTQAGGNSGAGSIVLSYPSTAVSSFTSAQTSPTNTTGTISYTLTMSESVSGMEGSDFENSGTATGCNFSVSSSSGTTFTISITSCSEGTLIPRIKATSVTGTTTGPSTATAASTTITIDRTAPTISSVTAPSSAIYGPGTALNFTVIFSESVTVSGTPRLPLTVGSTQRYANFLSLSDSRTATFRYTVQTSSNDIDTDGVSLTSPAELNSGSIADLATNSISNLAFSSPSLTGVRVAQLAAAPTITSITTGNQSLTVAFTAGANNGSDITNYQYSVNGGSSFTSFSPVDTTTPLSITGLTNNTTYQVRIRALTTLNGASTPGESSNVVAGTPSTAPVNTSPPSITGTAQIGQQLGLNVGTWTNSPTSYGYQWVRSQTLDGTYLPISGEIANGYTVRADDNSYYIKVVVQGINLQGSTYETSAATSRVKVPITISGGSNISTYFGEIDSSSAFTASGGYGALGLSVSPVHPQVSISNGVVVAGATLPVGNYTETVTATDSLGDTATTTMSITVLQGVVSAPSFTVTRGTLPGSFRLNFTPVTGAASYTVNVYRSLDSYANIVTTFTNYTPGADLQDGDPRTSCSGATPVCYSVALGHTFKFSITPVASAQYTSAGEGPKSGVYGIYRPSGASIGSATTGPTGLNLTPPINSVNPGRSGVIATAYASASNYTVPFDTVSVTIGASSNFFPLPGGESYTVTLRYLGAVVGDTTWFDSDESAQNEFGLFVLNKPDAPSNITAVRNGSESIRISWTLASGPYQNYYYHTSTNNSTWTSRGNTSSDSATITGLTNGTPVYVRVYNNGTGTYARASDFVFLSGTITPAGPPLEVATAGSSPGDASISLSWTAPSNNGGSAVTGYLIEYSASVASYSESITALASDTRLTLTGLINGTSYYVRIKAVNAVGEGAAVNFSGGSAILVKGTAGSIVGAVTSITRTSATLSVTVNARGNTTTPTLRWGLANDPQTDITLSSVSSDNVVLTSNITGLLPGRRYQVTSTTSPGISQDVGGSPIYFTTTPDSITAATATTSTSSITLSWAYDAGGSGYSFSYDVTATLNGIQIAANCQDVTAASGGLHSCTLSGLTANSAYVISITKSITGGTYGNGTSDAYTLVASTDPNVATVSLIINGGNVNLQFGATINIVATTNVAGKVTFRLNGRSIKGCVQKSTSSLQATCSWRPSIRGTGKISALFNPTSNLYTNVTTSPTNIVVARRTGSRS